jgi:hypothetical protein
MWSVIVQWFIVLCYLQATKQPLHISLVLGVAVDPVCLTAVGHLFQVNIFVGK